MNEGPTRINYRSYPSTPTVSYDLPMHGQRNIKKCKEQLFLAVAEWASYHSVSQRDTITEELQDLIDKTFKDTLEK